MRKIVPELCSLREFNKSDEVLINIPTITNSLALNLLRDELINGDCHMEGEFEVYRSCTLKIETLNDFRNITIIYEGFFDDSVRGSRIRAKTIYRDNNWVIEDTPIHDFQCWSGRGHEDFSTELCI